MNDIIINGTNKLPTVNLDAKNGLIEFSGRSIPEDGKEFYDEVFKWLNSYVNQSKKTTTAVFRMEYLNSSSHISIKNILVELAKLKQMGKSVEVLWYFEEDDTSMEDIALDYKEITDLPFEIIAVDKF